MDIFHILNGKPAPFTSGREQMPKRSRMKYLFVPFVVLLAMSCNPSQKQSQDSTVAEKNAGGITVEPFGKLEDGTPISLYTLSNSTGMKMKVMN